MAHRGVIFFVDNNLSVNLARAMDLLSDAKVEHLQDSFSPNAPDEEWLPWVGQSGRILLTRDLNIGRRPGERKAMIDNEVRGFLIGGKGQDRLNIFGNVALNWLMMEKIVSVLSAPFLITAHSPKGQWKDVLAPDREFPSELCPPLKVSRRPGWATSSG